MILPDANLLLYAYDTNSKFHATARDWCEIVMTGPEPVFLLPVVIFAYVRIATHPRVFEQPLGIDEACVHVDSWLARSHVRFMDMQREDALLALDLLRTAGVAGNLTADAQIAAVALRLDATVHTADLDFGRFPGVRHTNPVDSRSNGGK